MNDSRYNVQQIVLMFAYRRLVWHGLKTPLRPLLACLSRDHLVRAPFSCGRVVELFREVSHICKGRRAGVICQSNYFY